MGDEGFARAVTIGQPITPALSQRERGKSDHSTKALLFLTGIFDGEAGPGLGFEARLGDRFAGAFANAEGSVLDFGKRVVDLAQKLAILLDQAERELLLIVVGAHVGHVEREIR